MIDQSPDQESSTSWGNMGELIKDPSHFFSSFLDEVKTLSEADAAMLLVDSRIAASAPKSSPLIRPLDEQGPNTKVLEHPLPKEQAGAEASLVLLYLQASDSQIERAKALMPLFTNIPAWLENNQRLARAESDLGQFGSVLDLTVLLYGEDRFNASVMFLCNELASRYRCCRVSLGWLEGNEIHIRAISHTDKLEARMNALQKLAAVMEESVDQGIEVLYPDIDDRFAVDREHRLFAAEHKLSHLLTLPLLQPVSSRTDLATESLSDREPFVGAITLERDHGNFSDQELRSLRLLCDQVSPRLCQLKKTDGWIGRRAIHSARAACGKLLGVDHTWLKLLGIALTISLAVLIFGKKEFQVKAPSTVETDSMVYLSAPYNGYLGEAAFRAGDEVDKGTTLFALDTSELLLEEQQALAETTRHRAEAMRAEGTGEVSEMQVSKALLKQAEARLDLVRYQLENAEVSAPFDGVIVEGDLTEKLDAPVEKGDVLVKLAKISGLFPELKIDETDIRFIEPGKGGKIAFAARPDLSFPIEVERIEPAARSDEDGNTFTVRCRFTDVGADVPDWWRPGMTGIAKIDCGRRPLIWIFTRRTVDRIRIFLW